MISNLQKLVISARQSSSGDPFSEADTASQLDDHLCSKGYSVEDRAKCFKGLESTIPLRPQQELEELRLEEGEQPKATDVEPEPEGHNEAQAESEVKKDKRLKSENTKSESLGSNPKAPRELARAQLQKGYYQSTSGRNGTRVLHRLGACFMVPGIDYPRFVHLGALMPRQSDFDSICKLCARKGTEVAQGDSDVTQTSSSSEGGQ